MLILLTVYLLVALDDYLDFEVESRARGFGTPIYERLYVMGFCLLWPAVKMIRLVNSLIRIIAG